MLLLLLIILRKNNGERETQFTTGA